jgi:hypothetical protein
LFFFGGAAAFVFLGGSVPIRSQANTPYSFKIIKAPAAPKKNQKKSRLGFLADRFDLPAKRITTRFAQTVIRF